MIVPFPFPSRLLGVGWSPDKISIFVGPDCKTAWGQGLVNLTKKWHGTLAANDTIKERALASAIRDTSPVDILTGHSGKCDLGMDVSMVHKDCFASCCAMSHQMAQMDAFYGKGIPKDERVLILEEDAVFAPAAFAPETEAQLKALAGRDDWKLLKLGECETFTDDERVTVSPGDKCQAQHDDPSLNMRYQFTTALREAEEAPTLAKDVDIRGLRSYCSHAYLVSGALSDHLVETHFPIKNNGDDQINDACSTFGGAACLRLEKYVFNQNLSIASAMPSSCHPCDGNTSLHQGDGGEGNVALDIAPTFDPNAVVFETFEEPRPILQRINRFVTVQVAKSRAAVAARATVSLMVNNMCGAYTSKEVFPDGSCWQAASEMECLNDCYNDPTATSWIYHPVVNNASGDVHLDASAYFLCQDDPYTSLEHPPTSISAWQGKCCCRHDDKFTPFTPPVWFHTETDKPHVTSGSVRKDTTTPMAKYEYLSVGSHDEIDEDPQSTTAVDAANAVEYESYGTAWAVARSQCQRQNLDLCPVESYCKNGNRTRMLDSIYDAIGSQNLQWWSPQGAVSNQRDSLWLPTLKSCNSWVHLATCRVTDGSMPSSTEYASALGYDNITSGCCPAEEKTLSVQTVSDLVGHHNTRAYLKHPKNRNFVLHSLNASLVQQQKALRGKEVVLRQVVNHATSGLFASMQWAMITSNFADEAGVRMYIDHGPCTLSGYAPFTQMYSYHDGCAGVNAWEYFFKPTHDLSDLRAKGDPIDVVTLGTKQIWEIYGMEPFHIASFQTQDFTAGTPFKYYRPMWDKYRPRAWKLVGDGKRFQLNDAFKAYEAQRWSALVANASVAPVTCGAKTTHQTHQTTALAAPDAPVIGIHARATDKQCSIGGPIVPLEAYYPFIDAFICTQPSAVIFAATDSDAFAQQLRAKYGARLMMEPSVRSEKNALHEHDKADGYNLQKATGAMVDALHLSRATFVLNSNSALSEAAVWFNPTLANNMYNMQFLIPEQVQEHHHAKFGGVLDQLAQAYVPAVCPKEPTN